MSPTSLSRATGSLRRRCARTTRGFVGSANGCLRNSILKSADIETAERFVRTARNLNTRRNLAITLRSFATYLAQRKLWYLGGDEVRLSVLHGLAIPKPSGRGLPPYKDEEV